MEHPYCPGYLRAPFDALSGDYPGEDSYPPRDFRTEWGPIFHRGRLDGSARLLVVGQDPAAHEAVTRRILVGAAGQRVQGLLARIGVTSSYVMVNTFLYSVYGQAGGNRHVKDPAIAQYRHRWLDALLTGDSAVTAVITLGTLAERAYKTWAATRPEPAGRLHLAAVRHPTYPESAAAAGGSTVADATAKLLANWNRALPELRAHVVPDAADAPPVPAPYADRWQPGDHLAIPDADLPAGHPTWWSSLDSWAERTGPDRETKRATLTVTVPEEARPWH